MHYLRMLLECPILYTMPLECPILYTMPLECTILYTMPLECSSHIPPHTPPRGQFRCPLLVRGEVVAHVDARRCPLEDVELSSGLG
jgi:hypothetical protein